jgi:hypothetical protein
MFKIPQLLVRSYLKMGDFNLSDGNFNNSMQFFDKAIQLNSIITYPCKEVETIRGLYCVSLCYRIAFYLS